MNILYCHFDSTNFTGVMGLYELRILCGGGGHMATRSILVNNIINTYNNDCTINVFDHTIPAILIRLVIIQELLDLMDLNFVRPSCFFVALVEIL